MGGGVTKVAMDVYQGEVSKWLIDIFGFPCNYCTCTHTLLSSQTGQGNRSNQFSTLKAHGLHVLGKWAMNIGCGLYILCVLLY